MHVGIEPGRYYAFRRFGYEVVAHPVLRIVNELRVVVDETTLAMFVQPAPSCPDQSVTVVPRIEVCRIPELLRYKYHLPRTGQAYWTFDTAYIEQLVFVRREEQKWVPLREVALYEGIIFKLS